LHHHLSSLLRSHHTGLHLYLLLLRWHHSSHLLRCWLTLSWWWSRLLLSDTRLWTGVRARNATKSVVATTIYTALRGLLLYHSRLTLRWHRHAAIDWLLSHLRWRRLLLWRAPRFRIQTRNSTKRVGVAMRRMLLLHHAAIRLLLSHHHLRIRQSLRNARFWTGVWTRNPSKASSFFAFRIRYR